MTDEEQLDVERARLIAAQHAMQTGVAFTMGDECSPKHLRVGVNAAMSGHGALVKLLIDKGLITLLEYSRVAADYMEREAESYEKKIREKTGANITLR